MTESEGTGVQQYIRESNALKGGRSSTMLQSSMDRAARPRYRTNLVLRTAQTNLTSSAPTPSSAAQMLGENEDSCSFLHPNTVHGIACETLMTLHLLESSDRPILIFL